MTEPGRRWMMNSQWIVDKHYSFSIFLTNRNIHEFMNRWIVFCEFFSFCIFRSEYFFLRPFQWQASALPLCPAELFQPYRSNYYMEHYMDHYMCITCCVADMNSFAWYWKELEIIRKNSAQELEINFFCNYWI